MLHIEIWYTGLDRSDALDNHVREQVGHELKRFGERLTRVEAYLSDENAGKGGPKPSSPPTPSARWTCSNA